MAVVALKGERVERLVVVERLMMVFLHWVQC